MNVAGEAGTAKRPGRELGREVWGSSPRKFQKIGALSSHLSAIPDLKLQ